MLSEEREEFAGGGDVEGVGNGIVEFRFGDTLDEVGGSVFVFNGPIP